MQLEQNLMEEARFFKQTKKKTGKNEDEYSEQSFLHLEN
jgi:hypothetical protein